MNFKGILQTIGFSKQQPIAAALSAKGNAADNISYKIIQEYQDRSRKDIQKWRQAIAAAENPEDPRWYLLQDLVSDLSLDAHLCSVIDVRKMATLNHRFYITNLLGEQLPEQTALINKRWFYYVLDHALDAIFYKYSVLQFFRVSDDIDVRFIPRRNICPQLHRLYLEVSGTEYIDYSEFSNVLEISYGSTFGLLNDVAPNVIWKRNFIQLQAEYSAKFGMPIITAEVASVADTIRTSKQLESIGKNMTATLPPGAKIEVHDVAAGGDPEKTFLIPAIFHDNQISKRIIGSTTMVDEGANRSQTEIHQDTLDWKIAAADKRMITFLVNDKVFPILQSLGLPFDNTKMKFQFDETEDMSLVEQWQIVSSAMLHYELDEKEIAKTFNLPITGKKETDTTGGFASNFQ
jgi:hypothetical protein